MNTTQLLQLSPNSWTSLYIPIIPKDLVLNGAPLNTEEAMTDYLQNKVGLGKISRVDFITKQTKYDNAAISAFVHFEYWSENATVFRGHLDKNGECQLHGYTADGEHFVRFTSATRKPNTKHSSMFLTFKINKTPIPEVVEVPKNMHQIVNNYGLMEQMIEEQQQKIKEQQQKIEEQQQKIEELHAEIALLNNERIMDEFEQTRIENENDYEFTFTKRNNMFMRDTTLMY